ncbi:hypothetical protein NST77_00765 [Niallia sp. FSL W8-0177]
MEVIISLFMAELIDQGITSGQMNQVWGIGGSPLTPNSLSLSDEQEND